LAVTLDANSTAQREKRRATLVAVGVVFFLIVLKVTVGLITGSLGVLAQAADSVLDMVASVLAFFAVRAADRPPDAEHPYGHGKVENLSALAETLLLLVTCAWLIYESIQRLFFRPVIIEADVWGIGVMLLSILLSIGLSAYLMDVARRYRSQSLEGNALNFRTDVLSSSVVLLGLGLVALSRHLGPAWAWLDKADPVAALLVTLLVLRVSLQLGRRAVGELLDATPPGLAERISVEVGQVPGVETIGPVRVRQSGASTFVDLVVDIDRSVSLEQAHQIATAVEVRVSSLIPQGDVVVHVDLVKRSGESLPQTVSAIADRMGLRTHNVHAHEVRGHYFVDLYVETPADLTLDQAHELVSQLERAIRDELPHVQDIHCHIEPMAVPAASATPLTPEVEERLKAQIIAAAKEVPGLGRCTRLHIRPGSGGYDIVLHCLADPDLSVAEAHRLADEVEQRLLTHVPGISQVLVHVEPEDEG
jgi:cation diffusion facilitator family transporter